MDGQISIFDIMYPKFKIDKPIRLIELFSGYGSQALALKYLGVPFEHWKTCEWAIKSIQAYKDIHMTNDNTDYSKKLTEEQIKEYLYNKGISQNYNEPMSKEQVKRLSNVRTIYNNIQTTHNLVNIQQVKGVDLDIKDTDKYIYICSYSFPCQDLSLAGKGKGFNDTSTRSGMLWEVERILTECYELGLLPQCLVMENVPQVHQAGDNSKSFLKWQSRLEELGYKNYMQDLIATDYGIPQTRNRCFMVSILGDYSYTFPKPMPLKLKLKDVLENQVDEKYYLSDAMIKCFTRESEDGKFPRGQRFSQALKQTNENNIAGTITTAAGNRATDNFIIGNIEQWHQRGNVYSEEHSAPTICATDYKTPKLVLTKDTENYIEWDDGKNIQMNCRAWKDDKVIATLNTGGETKILENKSLRETLEQNEIDETCFIDTYNRKIDKEKSGTITTGVSFRNNTFVAIKEDDTLKKDLCNKLIQDGLVEEGDVVKHSYTQQILDGNKKCVEKNDGNMITLTTRGDCVGVAVKTIGNYTPSNHNASRIVDQKYSAPTVMENHGTITATQTSDLRIRKLTPK